MRHWELGNGNWAFEISGHGRSSSNEGAYCAFVRTLEMRIFCRSWRGKGLGNCGEESMQRIFFSTARAGLPKLPRSRACVRSATRQALARATLRRNVGWVGRGPFAAGQTEV